MESPARLVLSAARLLCWRQHGWPSRRHLQCSRDCADSEFLRSVLVVTQRTNAVCQCGKSIGPSGTNGPSGTTGDGTEFDSAYRSQCAGHGRECKSVFGQLEWHSVAHVDSQGDKRILPIGATSTINFQDSIQHHGMLHMGHGRFQFLWTVILPRGTAEPWELAPAHSTCFDWHLVTLSIFLNSLN